MEWAATESLKVGFVLQTFLQAVGFAVIFFLPPIFSSVGTWTDTWTPPGLMYLLQTFLSSTVFDIAETGEWTVSSRALTIWLEITLPLTLIFAALLSIYYYTATGVQTPASKLREWLSRSAFSEGKTTEKDAEMVDS